MSKDNKENKDKDALNITEEENLKEQYEFGLNEDKRDEVEKDEHKLPEDEDADADEKDDDSDKDKEEDGDSDEESDKPDFLDY